METLAEPVLEEWLKRAINHYRKLAAAEDPQVMEKVRDEINFDDRCQVFGFAVPEPAWQGYVVVRAKDLPEVVQTKENIPRWQVFDAMAEAFLHPVWDESLTTDEKPGWTFLSMRELGFHVLDQLLNTQRSSYHLPPDGYRIFVQHLPVQGYKCDMYNHVGPLADFPPEQWIENCFQEGRSRWKQHQEWMREAQARKAAAVSAPLYVESPYAGHGVFHARSVRFGVVSSNNLGDWYTTQQDFPGIVTHQDMVGGIPFKATQNGFLCLLTPDKGLAHKWLNYIMTGFLSEGLPALAVRDQDLASVSPPEGDGHSWGGTYPAVDRRSTFIFDQRRISNDELALVLRRAEHFAEQPYAEHLPTMLEAHTHLEDNEPTQSFVFSWSIIEPVVTSIWATYLKSRGVGGARKKKLEGTDWTLDSRSEVLQLAGLLSTELYGELSEVRRIRNRVFHGEEKATRLQAEKALGLADRLLRGVGAPIRAPKKQSAREASFYHLL
jgi:hypothetical protein